MVFKWFLFHTKVGKVASSLLLLTSRDPHMSRSNAKEQSALGSLEWVPVMCTLLESFSHMYLSRCVSWWGKATVLHAVTFLSCENVKTHNMLKPRVLPPPPPPPSTGLYWKQANKINFCENACFLLNPVESDRLAAETSRGSWTLLKLSGKIQTVEFWLAH